jgi:hypothetical protein
MISTTEDPELGRQMDTVRRDSSLLHRAYRLAKRRGQMNDALKYAAAGDAMGIAVGRPRSAEEMEGTARNRYVRNSLVSGGRPQPGGLGGYDNRHSSAGNPSGVGGYDFRQAKDRTVPGTGMDAAPGAEGPATPELMPSQEPAMVPEGELLPTPKLAASPQAGNATLQRRGFQRAWQMAKTQDERDEIVERAHDEGVPMNQAAIPSLERRGRLNGRIAQSGGEWAGDNFYGEGKMIPGSANPQTLEKVVPQGGLRVVDEKDLAYQRAIHSKAATEGRYRLTGDARPYTERPRGTGALTPQEMPETEYQGVGSGGITPAQIAQQRLARKRGRLL